MAIRRLYAIAAAALLASPSGTSAGAQVDKSAHDCKEAIRNVDRGKPSKTEEWAWATVLGCGAAGGSAARDAWLSLRSESDTSRIAAVYDRLWSFRDAALFDAARAMMADGSARVESRAFSAMFVIAQLFDNLNPEFGYFVSTWPFGVCRIASVSDRTIQTGTPLPTDAKEQARTVARNVLADSAAPNEVRSAARCVDQILTIDDRVRARKPPRTSGS